MARLSHAPNASMTNTYGETTPHTWHYQDPTACRSIVPHQASTKTTTTQMSKHPLACPKKSRIYMRCTTLRIINKIYYFVLIIFLVCMEFLFRAHSTHIPTNNKPVIARYTHKPLIRTPHYTSHTSHKNIYIIHTHTHHQPKSPKTLTHIGNIYHLTHTPSNIVIPIHHTLNQTTCTHIPKITITITTNTTPITTNKPQTYRTR